MKLHTNLFLICLCSLWWWTESLKLGQLHPRQWRRARTSDIGSRPPLAPSFPEFPKRRFVGILPHFDVDAIGCVGAHVEYARARQWPAVQMDVGILGKTILLLEPETIQAVMEDRSNIMYKSALDRRGVGLLTGQGVLLTDGPDHTRKRRLILPTMTDSSSMQNFLEIMTTCATDSLQDLASSSTSSSSYSFRVMDLTSSLAMRIVSLCLFSTDTAFSETLARDIHVCSEHVVYISRHPFAAPKWIPTRRNRQFRRSLSRLDELVQSLIDKGRARSSSIQQEEEKEAMPDLLSMLLKARYEDDVSKGLSDRELRDEVMTLFLAGHETTAVALAWTLWFLSAPEFSYYQDWIAAEGKRVQEMGGYTPAIVQDPETLKYTRAVLCEALRLRGPSWGFDREVQESVTLPGNVAVKKGDILLISPYFQHLDKSNFGEDADQFRPERFLEGSNKSGDLWDGPFSRSAYMPFGAGRKRCIGYRLAQWEMLVIMSTILREFRVKRCQEGEIKMVPGVTLRPEEGFELKLEKRESLVNTA